MAAEDEDARFFLKGEQTLITFVPGRTEDGGSIEEGHEPAEAQIRCYECQAYDEAAFSCYECNKEICTDCLFEHPENVRRKRRIHCTTTSAIKHAIPLEV